MSHTSTQDGGQLAAPTNPTTGTPAPATMTTFTQTDLDAAVAAATTAATTQERARLCAIQGHPNALSQPGLVKLCIDTGISATQATALLGAATSAPPAAANPFLAAMAATPNPAISGIEDPASTAAALDPEAQAQSIAASILGAYRLGAHSAKA